MYKCVQFTESMGYEWDRFALFRGTVFHTTAFRRILLETFGYSCGYHAVCDENGRICAIIPLVTGRNLKLKKAGVALPFANYADICADSPGAFNYAVASVMELKRKLHLDYIELRLKDQSLAGPDWSVQLQNHTFVLPLADSEEEVLALSTAGNRNHVRKAYKNGWFAVSFDPGNLDSFYEIYVKRMKELGSPAPDRLFFRRFFAYLPENVFLLTVLDRQNGKVIGGMLLLTSPANKTLYYPYGASLIEYNGKYVNNFMYWEAVRFGIRNGMKYLDLGRSQIGSGTYKYKAQWGAQAVQLKYYSYGGGEGGTPDRNKLAFFVELWKLCPGFITNEAGKHLIKYVMP